jgi:hypothetical protein
MVDSGMKHRWGLKVLIKLFLFLLLFIFCTVVIAVPIKVRTVPGNASVYIDNSLFAISDRNGVLSDMLFLMEGTYKFRAEKPGYNPVEKTIIINEATSILLEMIPSGVLSIRTFPEDAIITVDLDSKHTGAFEDDLPIGKHYIEVSRDGYIPRTFYLDIKQYQKRTLEVALSKEGFTKILSDPSGALVSVDGNPIGETPLETHIEPGKHILAFHKDWHYSESMDIEITGELTNEFTQILIPYANLKISASPADVTLRLDDSISGVSELIAKELSVGKHKLTLSADGYRPKEVEIYLEAGENSLSESLDLKEYPWTISATPAAVLMVDGKEIGLTPLQTMLSHGYHNIHLRSGEKEWMTKVEALKEGNIAVNLNFETTVLFDVIPAGQSYVIHKGVEYQSPALINTEYGLQTFDIVRGGYPVRRRIFKFLPGKIYEETINLEGESELFLVTKPSGASVYWMGAYIGKSPFRGEKIRTGSGTLKLVWDNGSEFKENLTLLDGETYTLYREIPSQTLVSVNSLPEELEIFLDGKASGLTPVQLYLKPGNYIISCQNSDGKVQEKLINLNGEKERTINFVF